MVLTRGNSKGLSKPGDIHKLAIQYFNQPRHISYLHYMFIGLNGKLQLVRLFFEISPGTGLGLPSFGSTTGFYSVKYHKTQVKIKWARETKHSKNKTFQLLGQKTEHLFRLSHVNIKRNFERHMNEKNNSLKILNFDITLLTRKHASKCRLPMAGNKKEQRG